MAKPGKLVVGEVNLEIECSAHVAIRLRRCFANATRWRVGVFKLAATPENAFDLDWFRLRHPLEIDDPDQAQRFDELVKAHKRKMWRVSLVEQEGYVPRTFKLALPPREYQRVAADLALRTGSLLVADDVGLGKTVTSLCALAVPGALPALIVTMTHLPRQWESEIDRFLPNMMVHRLRKGSPYKLTDAQMVVGADGKRRRVKGCMPDVIICNYHKLDGWVETLAPLVKTVIFDEVQELRHTGTNKYQAAKALAEEAKVRIGLSATPVYNYGAEIWAIMDVLAPNALGHWNEFNLEWCGSPAPEEKRDRSKVCVSDAAALGVYLREQGLMIRRTRKDVGRELPELTIVHHTVDVDTTRINEVVADVRELAQRVLDRIGTGLERMQDASEIDYRMRQATGIGKAPAVADLVRMLVDSGENVVLFGWHHEVYAIWRSYFEKHGITFAMYTGTESDTQKAESVRRFVEGEAKVIVISLRAGAGLDGLQKVSRTVVNGELDWSPAVRVQNIGRVHRDGQQEKVCVYDCIADEGSDPVIADVLGIKASQAQGIVDPDQVGEPILAGADEGRIRKLAEDILRRAGTSERPRTVSPDARDAPDRDAEATQAPADRDDDQGGAVDRGSPRAPVEDAGP